MAAQATQAACAGNNAEGRWARGPSFQSANTCAASAWPRWCSSAWMLFWSVSIVIGIQMFVRDKGLVWERTEKVDAYHDLVRDLDLVAPAGLGADVIDQPDVRPDPTGPAQLEHPAGRHRRVRTR